MAWFCHGLEERLRAQASPAEARRALDEAARWRGVLGEAVVAPGGALELLRATTEAPRQSGTPATRTSRPATPVTRSSRPVTPVTRSSRPATPVRATLDDAETAPTVPPRRAQESDPDLGRTLGEATLRVGAGKLERLLERVRRLSQTRSRIDDGARGLVAVAGKSRDLRDRLTEALRLIGPPRPWGAPMAAIARVDATARDLGALADGLDRESVGLSLAADRVRDEAALAHGELVEMRTTTAAALLERVAAAVMAQARRDGVEVRVQVRGGETPIERRVADGLFDPMLQLARNAVAHGLEPAEERLARGKPAAGSILLAAEPRSGGLRLRVEDDGAGVDVARVRERARSAGPVFAALAETADDQTVLGLLFVPGFSTRDTADLLAGRGVGLDLSLEAVRRLGGSIRLSSEPGIGLAAVLDVPSRGGLLRVLWVEAGGTTFALPVQQVRRVRTGGDAAPGYPLIDCLRGAPGPARLPPRFAAELEAPGVPVPPIGLDAVGEIEDVALLAISPLVLGAGPYAGAVLRGDELRMCLDGDALVELLGG
jgi:two-component system chemotaxis sensor kinase CheA